MALDQNVGTLIWGPLGEGLLTGAVSRHGKAPASTRQSSGWPEPYVHHMEHAYNVIDVLEQVGKEINASIAQVCLAWLAQRLGVSALIVGNRSEAHLRENLNAFALTLSEEQRQSHSSCAALSLLAPLHQRYGAHRSSGTAVPGRVSSDTRRSQRPSAERSRRLATLMVSR